MGVSACCGERGLEEIDNNVAKIEYDNDNIITNLIEVHNKSHNSGEFENIKKLEKGSIIKKGGFGKVLKVRIEKTDEIYALKESPINTPQNIKICVREQDILNKCHHPNIIAIKEAFKDRSVNSFYIVEEYAKGGTLREQINRKKKIEENTLIFWLMQICLALSYLHKKKIYHRDIKPENILLTGTQLIKIGDFGLSKHYKSLKRKSTRVGTIHYMAPEINSGKYDEKVDIYSLGKTFNDFLELNKNYSEELVNLVNSFMEEEPANRPSSDQILNAPIIKEGMKSFLKKNNYENSLAKLIMKNININDNKYIKDEGEDIFINDIKNERERLNHNYNKEKDSEDLDIIMCIIKNKLNE